MSDLLTWRRAPIGLAALVALVVVLRQFRVPLTLILFVLAFRYAAGLGDAWEGTRRQRAGLKATIGTGLGIGLWWPWPIWPRWWAIAWFVLPIVLTVYATRTIGASGSESRVQNKIATGFAAAAKHLPPDARQVGRAEVNGRTKRIKFSLPTGSPKMEPRTAALNIAQEAGLAAPQVQVVPLHHDKAGMYELVVRDGKPFDFPDPTYPDPATWPKGKFPLAWDADSDTVWLNMGGSNGKHMVIAGRTGSGKTNTQRVILRGMVQLRIALRLVDPHGEFHDYADHVQDPEHYATSAEAGAKLLAELVKDMRARLADKSLPRGPICCMVDEAPAVLAIKGAEANANALAMEGRKVGIVLVFAVQYPTVDLFGGPLRQQMSTVIVHRVKDRTGSNVALGQGAVGDGWDASDKRLMARQGRAIAELEGADEARQFIQVFEAPPAPAVEVKPEPLPAPSPLPPPVALVVESVRPSVRPPSGCTEQGEQPRTDGRTDSTPDDYDRAILATLNGHPMSANAIAKAAQKDKNAVGTRLKRMAEQGLVRNDGKGWVRA